MQPGASHPCAVSPGQRPGASQLMPSYEDTERTAREEATKVIEWFFSDHEMRAARCEREVLDRLLSIEQVRTASIDTQQSIIIPWQKDPKQLGDEEEKKGRQERIHELRANEFGAELLDTS